MEKKFKRTTVTSALPYANGPVHIGHLAGVYVPADIYVRYLRLKKEDVLFIGGSDEHGVPITIRAKKEGVTPQDVVDRYHYLIKKSFEEFGISFDVYSRTTSKTHHQLASDFFKTLYNKGEFIEKTSEQYYDEEAKTFLADRYITGECPHCHSEGAYGDQCEKCGTSLSPTDLINPKSAISGSKPVMKETKHWYLPLDKHEVVPSLTMSHSAFHFQPFIVLSIPVFCPLSLRKLCVSNGNTRSAKARISVAKSPILRQSVNVLPVQKIVPALVIGKVILFLECVKQAVSALMLNASPVILLLSESMTGRTRRSI